MAKKSTDDAEFIRELTAGRTAGGHHGMVMTKPPTGPSKSLEEILQDDTTVTFGAEEDAIDQTNVMSALDEPEAATNHRPPADSTGYQLLDINRLQRSPFQVRDTDDQAYIELLMESIQDTRGAISPIVVRPLDSNAFEIIAGHHRYTAYKRLGYNQVPVSVRNLTDEEAAKALAADNAVRKDLNDYERYKHAKMLIDRGFCKSKAECGRVLGVSRTLVSFLLAFDDFPDEAKAILEKNRGLLGASQANELREIALQKPELVTEAVKHVADGKLKQTAIQAWIEKQDKPINLRLPKRKDLMISHPALAKPIKITYTETEAKIQAAGLNIDKLEALIQANLENLIDAKG